MGRTKPTAGFTHPQTAPTARPRAASRRCSSRLLTRVPAGTHERKKNARRSLKATGGPYFTCCRRQLRWLPYSSTPMRSDKDHLLSDEPPRVMPPLVRRRMSPGLVPPAGSPPAPARRVSHYETSAGRGRSQKSFSDRRRPSSLGPPILYATASLRVAGNLKKRGGPAAEIHPVRLLEKVRLAPYLVAQESGPIRPGVRLGPPSWRARVAELADAHG